jgi:Aminotransferase class I and II
MDNNIPKVIVQQPSSPPSSPTSNRVRLSVTSGAGGDDDGDDTKRKILRSSLQLSPAWDRQCESLRHLGDLDDDDAFNVAFFPIMPPSIPDFGTAGGGGGGGDNRTSSLGSSSDPAVAVFTDGIIGDRGPRNKTESDDNWSTASLTDSIFSAFSAGGIWQDVPAAAPDAILGIAAAFRACDKSNKVNVCVGAYRDENGNPYVLPTVRKAEYRLLEQNENKEYLPIEGDKDFIACAMKFAYGTQNQDFLDTHLAAVQTLSGTGACSIGGRFLAQFWPDHPIYVPDPTWGNHHAIFKACGLKVRKYRYYDRSKNRLDLEGMIEDLHRAHDGSIILLHACAHNVSEEVERGICLCRYRSLKTCFAIVLFSTY